MKTGISKGDRSVLLRLGAGERVPSSQMSERLRKACDPGWMSLRLVDCEMSGLRRRVYVARPDRLAEFDAVLERTFPGYATKLPLEMTRSQAAQLQGNSKLAPMKDNLVVLRDVAGVLGDSSTGDDLRAYWVSMLEKVVVPAGLTVLTVENEDTFQKVAPGVSDLPNFHLAVLAHGYAAERTIRWIASIPNCDLVHYGDFDWEGMRVYQTIREQLSAGACRLHRPAMLEAAFARQRALGKGSMANNQRRPEAKYPEVAEVLDLIDRYGGVGVEQQVFDVT